MNTSNSRMLRTLPVALLAFVFAHAAWAAPLFKKDEKRMNLVLICMDTVRADTFALPESTGTADKLTPWLKKGVVFANARSTSSWTIPAVASVLSGFYPLQHGAGIFPAPTANLDVETPSGLSQSLQTLPERLSGYGRAAFVESPFVMPPFNLIQGFAPHLVKDAAKAGLSAINGAPEDAPIFVYLHLMAAHGAHFGDLADVEKRASAVPRGIKSAVLTHSVCSEATGEACTRHLAYVAAVMKLRGDVASVLDALQKKDLLSNTVVVLFSDHGEEFGEHRAEETARKDDPRGIYGAGHGQAMYEEILRVPLVIWRPNVSARVVRGPVSLIDVPTSLALWLKVGKDVNWPGINLDMPESFYRGRTLYASGIAYGHDQSVAIRENLKLIDIPCSEEHLLFDLVKDKTEKAPLPSTERMVDELRRSLIHYRNLETSRRRPAPTGKARTSTITPEQRKSLQSLGYLSGGRGGDKSNPCADTVKK